MIAKIKSQTTYNQEFSSKREEYIALQYRSVGSINFNISRGATEKPKILRKNYDTICS